MKRTLCLSTLLGAIAAQTALEVGSDLCTHEQLLTLDTFSVKASVLDNFCLANSDFLSDECFCDQENYDRTRKQIVWSRTCYNDTDSLEYLADYEAFIVGLCQEYSPAVVNNTFTLPDNLSYSETSSCNSSIAQYTAAIDNYFDCQYQYDNTTNDSSEEVVECYCRNAQGVIDALDSVNSDCDDDSVDNSARSLYETFVRSDCTGLTLRGTTFSVSLPTTTRTTTRRSTTARTPTARTTTARTATTGAATTGATPTTAADATQATTTVAPTAAPVTTQASSGAHPVVSEYGSPLLVQIAILALIVTTFVL